MAALTPTTPEDHYNGIWSNLATSTSFYSGYLGQWYVRFGKPEGVAVKGMRVWTRVEDGEKAGAQQWNVYSSNIAFMRPDARKQDGNFEMKPHYGLLEADPIPYDPNIQDVPEAGPTARKLFKVAPEAVISLQATLPPQRTANAAGPAAPWYSEVFIHDGPYRWSSVVGYQAAGPINGISLISEMWHQLDDPAAPINFDELQTPEQRPSLPQDPSEWLPEEAWSSGTASGLHVQPDGSIWRTTEPGPASKWDPAALKDSTSQQLVLLPDSMYLCLPRQLPASAAEGLKWEFGGRMRQDPGSLARVVIVYGPGGKLQSVVHERFTCSS